MKSAVEVAVPIRAESRGRSLLLTSMYSMSLELPLVLCGLELHLNILHHS